jgi:hypothetical protein
VTLPAYYNALTVANTPSLYTLKTMQYPPDPFLLGIVLRGGCYSVCVQHSNPGQQPLVRDFKKIILETPKLVHVRKNKDLLEAHGLACVRHLLMRYVLRLGDNATAGNASGDTAQSA